MDKHRFCVKDFLQTRFKLYFLTLILSNTPLGQCFPAGKKVNIGNGYGWEDGGHRNRNKMVISAREDC